MRRTDHLGLGYQEEMLFLSGCFDAGPPRTDRPDRTDPVTAETGDTSAPDTGPGELDSAPDTGIPPDTADTGVSIDTAGTADSVPEDSACDTATVWTGAGPSDRTADTAFTIDTGGAERDLSFALPGDLTADGVSEIVVGSSAWYWNGFTYRSHASALVLVDGGTLTELTRLEDEATGLGWALARLDLDGDGAPELLAGAPTDSTNGSGGETYPWAAGALQILDGAALESGTFVVTATWLGANEYIDLGTGLATVPDLDGDGFDEIVIGADEAPNYLLRGGPDALAGGTSDDLEILTSQGNGFAVGDLDGDGLSELLTTCDSDCWLVYAGADLGGSFDWTAPLARVELPRGGYTVAPLTGEIDGDGQDDAVFDSWVVSGATLTGDLTLQTCAALDIDANVDVTALGDLDGDGHDDLVGERVSETYLFDGATLPRYGTIDQDYAWYRLPNAAEQGTFVAEGWGGASTVFVADGRVFGEATVSLYTF